jgi:hypothetical protein
VDSTIYAHVRSVLGVWYSTSHDFLCGVVQSTRLVSDRSTYQHRLVWAKLENIFGKALVAHTIPSAYTSVSIVLVAIDLASSSPSSCSPLSSCSSSSGWKSSGA